MAFLQDMFSSLWEQGKRFNSVSDKRDIADLCEALMSGQGEVSGTKVASAVLAKYEQLDQAGKQLFFERLQKDYDLDPKKVIRAAEQYADKGSRKDLERLIVLAKPRRQELLRRLNQVPGATEKLVHMREDLFPFIKSDPDFALVDSDFEYVFSNWFNRGFLLLKPIDWRTPANILERIIAYEAVHAINDWDDLRRRLQPADRRCFAFFHPVMPEEPLIFVEVALTKGVPNSVGSVLAGDRDILPGNEADTAVFYSISNCQEGLRGVSFGNFLIKQVVEDLKAELPNIKKFVTLSPVPLFTCWMRDTYSKTDIKPIKDILTLLAEGKEELKPSSFEPYQKLLIKLFADYLVGAKRGDRFPYDPVSRFHLGNGASLARLNWMADQSANGLRQSAGMMVNYQYDLGSVESNHESYVNDHQVHTTKETIALAKSDLATVLK
ncbi:MAG: malonyl-CoA decarboxylase [Pseudomonadota bacterium]